MKNSKPMNLSKEELCISVGKVIRELRINKKMSIEALANQTGIGYSQLSRIERGKINTSLYQFYLIIVTINPPMNTVMKELIKSIINHHKNLN